MTLTYIRSTKGVSFVCGTSKHLVIGLTLSSNALAGGASVSRGIPKSSHYFPGFQQTQPGMRTPPGTRLGVCASGVEAGFPQLGLCPFGSVERLQKNALQRRTAFRVFRP